MNRPLRLAMRTVAALCGAFLALFTILVMGAVEHGGRSGGALLVLCSFAALSALCLWFARTGRRSWWPALFGAALTLVVQRSTLAGLGWAPHSDAGRLAIVVAACWTLVAIWRVGVWGLRLRPEAPSAGRSGVMIRP